MEHDFAILHFLLQLLPSIRKKEKKMLLRAFYYWTKSYKFLVSFSWETKIWFRSQINLNSVEHVYTCLIEARLNRLNIWREQRGPPRAQNILLFFLLFCLSVLTAPLPDRLDFPRTFFIGIKSLLFFERTIFRTWIRDLIWDLLHHSSQLE